jgi:hypothetical protein
MPCSRCHKKGHNKLKCPWKNSINYTNIITCVSNALDCIDNTNKTNTLLTDIEPTTNKYLSVTCITEYQTHCGYCSDNDGTTDINNYNRDIMYIILPQELDDQINILKTHIENGYFNNYELPSHSQCYCGLNSIKNTIISIDLIIK